jgi:hypothetical protein
MIWANGLQNDYTYWWLRSAVKDVSAGLVEI